jgi:hypothetical protein
VGFWPVQPQGAASLPLLYSRLSHRARRRHPDLFRFPNPIQYNLYFIRLSHSSPTFLDPNLLPVPGYGWPIVSSLGTSPCADLRVELHQQCGAQIIQQP